MAKKPLHATRTLVQAVADYRTCGLDKKLMGNLKKCTTDAQCVYGPNFSPATGKTKHPHQRRIPGIILSDFLSKVKQMNPQAGQFKNFDDFFDATCKYTGKTPSLMVYDYCLRKGIHLGLMPDKYVYLFCGARDGYKLASGVTAIHYRVCIQGMRNNPAFNPIFSGFPNVSCAIVEDILCYYHQRRPCSANSSNCGCNGNSIPKGGVLGTF